MPVTLSPIKQPLFAPGRLVATPGALELPENPLDQLVNHFGESNVCGAYRANMALFDATTY
jgi:hypothetical protein